MRRTAFFRLADGSPPYPAEVRLLTSALGGASPGAHVAIRAGLANRQAILIETD